MALIFLILGPIILISVVYTFISALQATAELVRKRPSNYINWAAVNSEEVSQWLPDNRTEAINAYRALTGVSLREAKSVIDFVIKGYRLSSKTKKKKSGQISDNGIRELLRQGHTNEAIDLYQGFTGLSYDETIEAIEQITQEVDLAEYDSPQGRLRQSR